MLRWTISETANPLPNMLIGFSRWLKPANLQFAFRHSHSAISIPLLEKMKGHADALSLLGKLKSIVRVSPVTGVEIQSALSSTFKDFEDAIQFFGKNGRRNQHNCDEE
jgi:hypothetical protein